MCTNSWSLSLSGSGVVAGKRTLWCADWAMPPSLSRCLLSRLRLARVGETMFPPRAPFFWSVRFDARAAEIAANVEEFERGNLPVSPSPFREAAHAASSNLDVISRNRCSSEACTGSSRRTAMPASTRRRLSSDTAAGSVRRARNDPPSSVTSLTASLDASNVRACSIGSASISRCVPPPSRSSAIVPCATMRPRSTIATRRRSSRPRRGDATRA